MADASNRPDGTTEYYTTPNDPNLLSVYVWSAADQAWLYKGLVRSEDLPGHRMQTAAATGLRAALHSYVHVARRPNVKPYFKLPSARPTAGRQAERAARDGGPWNVPDLCAAYNWPTGLAWGRCDRDRRTRRRLGAVRHGSVLRRHPSAGSADHRRFG